jgi:hypothetical protein
MTVDDTAHLLEPYVLTGRVVIRNWDFDWTSLWVKVQTHSQNDCLARAAASHSSPSWVILLDVDEFIIVAIDARGEGKGKLLGEVLEESGGDVDAIKLAWLQYSGRDQGAVQFHRHPSFCNSTSVSSTPNLKPQTPNNRRHFCLFHSTLWSQANKCV